MSCWLTVSPLLPRRRIIVDNAAREGDAIDNKVHWNTVTEEVYQAKWRLLESLSERQKA